MLRVLLCDDQILLAQGIQLILESDGNIEVVGVYTDAVACFEAIPPTLPNDVVMDL